MFSKLLQLNQLSNFLLELCPNLFVSTVLSLGLCLQYLTVMNLESARRSKRCCYDLQSTFSQAKDYPWRDGKRSLFHHEYYNPVPGQGYSWQKKEEDDE